MEFWHLGYLQLAQLSQGKWAAQLLSWASLGKWATPSDPGMLASMPVAVILVKSRQVGDT